MNLQTYPNSPLEVLVKEICGVLKSELQPITTTPSSTAFHCSRKCSDSSLLRTVQHITKYAPCTVECLAISILYIIRLKSTSPPGFINTQTVEQLYVVGVMIASKYYDDLCYNNSVFSRILSIPKLDLRVLEVEYLRRLAFDCSFSLPDFVQLSTDRMSDVYSEKTGYYSLTKRVFELLYPQSKSLTTSSRSQQQKQQQKQREQQREQQRQREESSAVREKWRFEKKPGTQKGAVQRAAEAMAGGD